MAFKYGYIGFSQRRTQAAQQGQRYGVARLKINAINFLDIPDEIWETAPPTFENISRDAHSRRLLRGGVGDLDTGAEATIPVAEGVYSPGFDAKNIGSKTIILTTGIRLDPLSQPVSGNRRKPPNYRTIAVRFPGWATNGTIAELLALIIPVGKFQKVPGATEIAPFFKTEGGRSHAIPVGAADTLRPQSALQSLAQLSGGLPAGLGLGAMDGETITLLVPAVTVPE